MEGTKYSLSRLKNELYLPHEICSYWAKFVSDMLVNIGLYGKCTFEFVSINIEFVLGMFVLAGDNCMLNAENTHRGRTHDYMHAYYTVCSAWYEHFLPSRFASIN